MDKKKILFTIGICLFIFIGSTFNGAIQRRISNDIEAGAKIIIAVDSAEYGEALLALWNTTYPQYLGVVDYKVVGDYLDMTTDIIYGRLDELNEIKDQLLPLASSYLVYESNQDYYLKESDEVIFHPVYYEGMIFVYNETMLKELGIDTLDSNGDGLPESFDTFEELFELSEMWKAYPPTYHEKALAYIFPISLEDPVAFYPFVTAGGWSLEDRNDLKYDGESFLLALEFISELGNYQWSYKKEAWDYEKVIREESAPFSMVADWMYYESNSSEFRYARFPSYQGVQLKPLVYIYGYSINGNTSYPKAAQKVIDLLGSSGGVQLAVDYGSHVAIIPYEIYSQVQIDTHDMLDWIEAYRYSQVVSSGSILKEYYDMELMEVFRKVFNHTITPIEAVELIQKLKESE